MKLLINIDVPELAPAIAFYDAALGLALARVLDDDVAELAGGESTIYLLKNDAGTRCAPGPATPRDYSRHWTPVHMDFVVEDIDRAARRALDAGAVRESECVAWRGSKCITFSDPFGHGFCLIEFTGDGYSERVT